MRGWILAGLAGLIVAGCDNPLTGDYVLDDHPDVTLRIDQPDVNNDLDHTYELCRGAVCEAGEMHMRRPRPDEDVRPFFQGTGMEQLQTELMNAEQNQSNPPFQSNPDGEAMLYLYRHNGEPRIQVSTVSTTSFRRVAAEPEG